MSISCRICLAFKIPTLVNHSTHRCLRAVPMTSRHGGKQHFPRHIQPTVPPELGQPHKQVSKAAGRVLPSHHSSCSFWSIQREPTQQARDFNTPWVPKVRHDDRTNELLHFQQKGEQRVEQVSNMCFFWVSLAFFPGFWVSECFGAAPNNQVLFNTDLERVSKHEMFSEAKIHAKIMRSIPSLGQSSGLENAAERWINCRSDVTKYCVSTPGPDFNHLKTAIHHCQTIHMTPKFHNMTVSVRHCHELKYKYVMCSVYIYRR